MTPLTHAVVGAAIYQRLRRVPRVGWALAFLLAFASHYLLDRIPHFEGGGALLQYRGNLAIFLGLGVIGAGLALLLLRWNRGAGLIVLILSLWIGLGNYAAPLLRIPTAILGLAYLAYKSRQVAVLGYLLAGMLAVAPDLIPIRFDSVADLHRLLHYSIDWGMQIYLRWAPGPIPLGWRARLLDPYFLLGFGLELLVEAVFFFGALYLLSRERFPWADQAEPASEVSEEVLGFSERR